jgi:hypothetical protein
MNHSNDEDSEKLSIKSFNLVLTILSIIVIIFSTGFYVINRISELEKAVVVECEVRTRIERQINRMDEKIEKILDRLPEKGTK